MYDLSSFTSELNSLQLLYQHQKPRWYRARVPWSKEVNNAWRLYSNAKANNLGMLVLGGEDIRTDADLTNNMGTTAANPVDNRSGTTVSASAPSGSNTTGSVLKERFWWPMLNDAWVLGGLHGLAQFHLASPSIASVSDDSLWDAGAKRPRVLGREIIGLFNFGYVRVSHDHEAKLGIVFSADNKLSAQGATFRNYLTAINLVTSVSNIKSMLTPNVKYTSYRLAL